MGLRKHAFKWVLLVVAVSLLLPGAIVYGAEKTSTVTLRPTTSAGQDILGATPTSGMVNVTSSTGPGGSASASVVVDITLAEHTYALYLGRTGRTFTNLGLVTWISGNGGSVTLEGISLAKAPTNGQVFQLVDLTAGSVVAVSDPVRY